MTSHYPHAIVITEYQSGIADISRLADHLINGRCVIIKRMIDSFYCSEIVDYLSKLRLSLLPAYQPISLSSPNNFRLNHEDPRASVSGYFEQFNFYGHNQDLLHIFTSFMKVFKLKDTISHAMSGHQIVFDSMNPPTGFVSRVGFQFYPDSKGYLAEHSDFVGINQYVVPSLVLSKRGSDYADGGFYYRGPDNAIVDPEPYVDIGDIILFNPQLLHGVSIISANKKYDWKKSHGRWMAFATTTKTT